MERRSGIYLMSRLILELKSLLPIMLITIILGTLGFLAAIGIASFATIAIGAVILDDLGISFNLAIILMTIFAVIRGFLRYGEQLSGHYIAFKLLAVLRDKVFRKLRVLAPAKLQGKDKGDLISLITSDIELLEVFYAHTIAPITIAIITNSIIVFILTSIHPAYGIIATVSFTIVGFVIPYFSSKAVAKAGVKYREDFANTNQFVLDSLRGLKEILFFNQGEVRLKKLNQQSNVLNQSVEKIKHHEGAITGITSFVISLSILIFVGLGYYFYTNGVINNTLALIAIVMIASSFGPVTALSNLSNTLSHTFACANRLFNLLDEEAQVEEVIKNEQVLMETLAFKNVGFAYPNSEQNVLENTNVEIKKGEKIGLIGQSGIGKSTTIKLLMRYFDVTGGEILIDDESIKNVSTTALRVMQTLVEQETYLFNDTIFNNIAIGKADASLEEIVHAAKKASIHDFIETLPQGYETKIGELGGRLSSGERQRLGLARAFLHDGEVLILDEPTSNLDALNEGVILKSIADYHVDKTIIMISHRKSSTSICEKLYRIENKQLQLEG